MQQQHETCPSHDAICAVLTAIREGSWWIATTTALAEFSSVGFARFSLHSKTSDAQQAT